MQSEKALSGYEDTIAATRKLDLVDKNMVLSVHHTVPHIYDGAVVVIIAQFAQGSPFSAYEILYHLTGALARRRPAKATATLYA